MGVAQQDTNDDEESMLENNYDEILDAVNTIFGSGTTEEVNGGEEKVIATTEVETLATEQPLPTTTILPTTTSESSSAVSTVDIVTEAATPVSVSSSSSTDVPKTDDSKIHFRDDGPVRDFTKRIFVDDGLVDARRKAIEARRKAASDASRIFFPTEEEGGASIPS